VKALDKLTRALESALIVLLFGMFLMIAVLVVLRYLFATTIIGGNEATIVAFIYTTAIGASIALLRDEHIAINYFVDKLSPRLQAQLLQLRLVLLGIVNLAIVVYSIAWIQRTGGFLMPTLGVPQMVAQLSIPLGGSLSVLYCAVRLLR
jgi:TRAP-type C4-dicarboxylate transport system permease small subunit